VPDTALEPQLPASFNLPLAEAPSPFGACEDANFPETGGFDLTGRTALVVRVGIRRTWSRLPCGACCCLSALKG